MKNRLGCALLFVLGLTSLAPQLLALDNVKVAWARQDFSDCVNSTVTPSDPLQGEGFVNVNTEVDGSLIVLAHLRSASPSTTYHIFLKCVGYAGDLTTDAQGVGSTVFTIPPGTVGSVFAFDMYPDGAPLGDKFQSVQLNLSPPTAP